MTVTVLTVTRRPVWAGLGVLAMTMTGLIMVAQNVIAAPGVDPDVGRSRRIRVSMTATGLGLPTIPGGTVVSPVRVANAGATVLRYALSSTVTPATLAAGYRLVVKAGVKACTAAGFGASGTRLYAGPLGSATGARIVGDRLLAPGTSEVLCTQVTLPLTTGNELAGRTLTTELLTVNAEAAN